MLESLGIGGTFFTDENSPLNLFQGITAANQ